MKSTLDKSISRRMPLATLRELNKLQSGLFLPVFLEITHPMIGGTLRFVADNEDFEYGGNLYKGYAFKIVLLNDTDALPTAQLTIQNIDPKIEAAILDASDPASLTIRVCDSASFDLTVKPRTPIGTPNVLIEVFDLYLTEVTGNPISLTGKIVTWAYNQEPYPFIRATQERTPGLFK